MKLFSFNEGYWIQPLIIEVLSYIKISDCMRLTTCSKSLRDIILKDENVWKMYCKMLPCVIYADSENVVDFENCIKNSLGFPSYESMYLSLRHLSIDMRFTLFQGTNYPKGSFWCMYFKSGIKLIEIKGDEANSQKISLCVGRKICIKYNSLKKKLQLKETVVSENSTLNIIQENNLTAQTNLNSHVVHESFTIRNHYGKPMIFDLPSSEPTTSDESVHLNTCYDMKHIPSPLYVQPNLLLQPVNQASSMYPSLSLSGIFVGRYFTHGVEFVQISCHSSDHDPDRLLDVTTFGENQLQGLKITGDPNVPSGNLTFCIDLNRQKDPLHVFSLSERPIWNLPLDHHIQNVALCVSGFGQINRVPGTWLPEWKPCVFVLYSTLHHHVQRFCIVWEDEESPSRHSINFSHLSDTFPYEQM